MQITLECRATTTTDIGRFLFTEENYVALAEWERDHSWGQLQLYRIETMMDLMHQKIRQITKGFTHRGSSTDIRVFVNGMACYLNTEYNIRTMKTHFYLRSECAKYEVELTVDERDLP